MCTELCQLDQAVAAKCFAPNCDRVRSADAEIASSRGTSLTKHADTAHAVLARSCRQPATGPEIAVCRAAVLVGIEAAASACRHGRFANSNGEPDQAELDRCGAAYCYRGGSADDEIASIRIQQRLVVHVDDSIRM